MLIRGMQHKTIQYHFHLESKWPCMKKTRFRIPIATRALGRLSRLISGIYDVSKEVQPFTYGGAAAAPSSRYLGNRGSEPVYTACNELFVSDSARFAAIYLIFFACYF